MKLTRLRDKLLLNAVAISMVVALSSMLAVSWVIRQQHLAQSNALLTKASRVIDDSLVDRKDNLLAASRQLATQNNLGSTIWYLAQYAKSGVDRDTLSNTYQQLATDTFKIGRVAKVSKIAIYDSAGNLVSFALFNRTGERVGFVERFPAPTFQVAELKEGEELTRQTMRATQSVATIASTFGGRLPPQENAHYAVVDGMLAIESHVPIMGVAFDTGTGKQEIKQLGLVAAVQPLDQSFVDYLVRLTDIKVNIFTPQGFSGGSMAAYRNPDWGGVQALPVTQTPSITFNEIVIDNAGYYQGLIPLYNDKHLVGTIAALQSKEIVRKNINEMIEILGAIAAACLLLIFPVSWYFAASISHPLTVLSRIFRRVASGRQTGMLSTELSQLERGKSRHDELGDLTQSFIAMADAVNQKMQQINEINASLEQTIAQRTLELRFANEELTKLVTHDALTSLPNRDLVSDRLQRALIAAKRDKTGMALMFIDLDGFKLINDTLGHDMGDRLLKETAKRIQACMRESDTVARIGGDEFLVLLPIVEQAHDATVAAEKIRLVLNQPFEMGGEHLHISSSIGIAIYPDHGMDENTLRKNADTAMYDAKKCGGNRVRIYSSDDVEVERVLGL